MGRYVRNIVPVTLAALITALMIYGAVLLVAPSVGSNSTLVAATGSTGTLTCPRTGCTASSCHATAGVSGADAVNSGAASAVRTTPTSWDD